MFGMRPLNAAVIGTDGPEACVLGNDDDDIRPPRRGHRARLSIATNGLHGEVRLVTEGWIGVSLQHHSDLPVTSLSPDPCDAPVRRHLNCRSAGGIAPYPAHIRSPLKAAAPLYRLQRARAQDSESCLLGGAERQ